MFFLCRPARNNSAPTGRIFIVSYLSTFRKSDENVKVSLKSDKNEEYVTWGRMHIYYISLKSSLNEKCFSQEL